MKTNEQILELNQRLHQAEEMGRADELDQLLGENFSIIHSDGAKVSRQEYLEQVAAAPLLAQRVEQPDVHLYGDNAVYTCITTVAPDNDGHPTRYWNMRLFHYQNGKWLCTAWQVTKLCTPSQAPFNGVQFAYASGAK